MRIRVALVVTLALLGALLVRVTTPGAAGDGGARLTITSWATEGMGTDRIRRTLRCTPPGGTLPGAAAACARLATPEARQALAPLPPGRACTQIAGGPEHAVVSGRLAGGRTIWVHLRQTDGCQIARWQALAFLLPSR